MSEKVKNKIILLEPNAKSVNELVNLIKEKDLAELVPVKSPDEALQQVVGNLPCILVASINDNQDVPKAIQMFKRLEAAVKHHGLKIYVVTPIKNRQLADMATQKLGVADYIVEPVPVRTMQFKINLQIKAVDNFRKQQELKKLAEEKVVIKKLDNKRADNSTQTGEIKTNQKPALQAGEDTFLFKNNGVKKAGKKFTVELDGPAPETGEWVQHEDKGDAQTSWRWVPNEEKEKQASGAAPKDGWVHEGDKPVFNEATQKWAMTSEKPSLTLQSKGKAVAQKLGVDEDGEVFVAEDSAVAEENLKKNREKAAALRPKKEAIKKTANAKTSLEDDDTEEEESEEGGEGQGTGKGTGKKGKKGASGEKKKRGIGDLGFDDDEDEDSEASAGELNDRTQEGDPEKRAAFSDKRDPSAKKEAQELKLKGDDGSEQDDDAATPVSPLEFLKKKKEEQKNITSLKADPAGKGVNALKEGEEDGPQGVNSSKLGKSQKPEDKLARLSASLEEGAETAEEKDDFELPEDFKEDGEVDDNNPDGPVLGIKGRAARELAEKLRSDPAEKRAELRDLQANGGGKKSAGLRQEKKKTLEEIQSLLQEPISDEMSAEEEEAIREELGLKGRPEIKPRELAKKKRAKDAKELKDRLAELDDEIAAEEEAEAGEATSGLNTAEEDEVNPRTRGDLSPEKLKGIRQALDSEESLEEEEETSAKKKKKQDEEKKKKRASIIDESYYMPEAELTPLGNAWDSAGTYYVYLNAEVRYKGFGKLEELLPLWTFEGEEIPQLLDKTKQWRFRGGKPVLATTVVEIPGEVRDFLTGLRDQIEKSNGVEVDPELAAAREEEEKEIEAAEAAQESAKESRAEKETKTKGRGKEISELFADEEDEETSEETRAEEEAPESEEEKEEEKDENAEAEDLLARARKNKEEGKTLTREEKRALAEAAEKEESSEEEDFAATRKRDREETESSTDEDAQTDSKKDDEAEDEGDSDENSKDSKKSEDPMERLRRQLEMTPEEEDSETDSADEKESDEERSSLDHLEETKKKERKPEKADLDALSEKLGALPEIKSEGAKNFLEKRRQKKEMAALEEALGKTPKPPETVVNKNPPPGFLGIYVALSDAYAVMDEPAKKLCKVLGAMEGSFRNCSIYCVTAPNPEGKSTVLYHAPGSQAPSEPINFSEGVSEAIQSSTGASQELLGYLYLAFTDSRTSLENGEEVAFRKMAGKLWPLLNEANKISARESKAA